jgi:V8-like Glu-specific endopeptidase
LQPPIHSGTTVSKSQRPTAMHRSLALAAAAVLLAQAPAAHAIVINDTAGAAGAIALGTPHTAVVELYIGGGLCSGAVVSATQVITAEHCTTGSAPANISVRFHQNNDAVPEAAIGVTSIVEMNPTNNLLDGTDLALLTLAGGLPAWVTPLQFFIGDMVGWVASMVGFGLNGIGSTGAVSYDGRRRAAENIVDSYGQAFSGGNIPGTTNIINTDFDDGSPAANTLSPLGSAAFMLTNEGTTAGGDSGGPLLINGYIAGILAGGSSANSGYGDVSWWTGLRSTSAQAFLNTNCPSCVSTDSFTVPEPASAALFASALALITLRRRSPAANPPNRTA